MKYHKPELRVLDHAVHAIQSGQNKSSMYVDNVNLDHPMNATATAYEADE